MEEDLLKGDYCRVHIRVLCESKRGQTVGITGLNSLGSAQTVITSSAQAGLGESGTASNTAIKLVTTPEAYPIWYTASPIILPRGSSVEYKYCLIEAGNVKLVEQLPTSRKMSPLDADHVVEDTFFMKGVEDRTLFDMEMDDHSNREKSRQQLSSTPSSKHNNRSRTNSSSLVVAWNNSNKLRAEKEKEKEQREKELLESSNLTNTDKTEYLRFAIARQSRLFLICYHLPVNILRTGDPQRPFEATWAESIIAKTSNSVSLSLHTIWIGTISIPSSQLTADERTFLINYLQTIDCVPIFLEDDVAEKAYLGFCKTILWPVFHNVDQLDQIHAAWNLPSDYYEQQAQQAHAQSKTNYFPAGMAPTGTRSRSGSLSLAGTLSETEKSTVSGSVLPQGESKVLSWNTQSMSYHEAYRTVNDIFAHTIFDIAHEGDIAWIHDYHLMLVPSMLRTLQSQRNAKNNTCSCNETNQTNDETIRSSFGETDSSKKKNELKVIFFLHIPFPTSQIFRTLPASLELLESMVCADLVGFHAFDHARHFLNAAKRMLGLTAHTRPGGMLLLSAQDREVIITMSHVSIETDHADELLSRQETRDAAEKLQASYRGMKVIAGIDVCQRLSGVALKLAGFEKYGLDLLNQAERSAGVVLVQRVVRPKSREEDEETTAADLQRIVRELNSKFARAALRHKPSSRASSIAPSPALSSREPDFSEQVVDILMDTDDETMSSNSGKKKAGESSPVPPSSPINRPQTNNKLSLKEIDQMSEDEAKAIALSYSGVFIDFQVVDAYHPMSDCERLALYLSADLLLLTPIREGLNLHPLEYIYARRTLPRAGAVIVSEFSTCSSLLNGSLKVNPFSPLAVCDAIEKSLSMSSRECEYRRQRDLPFILSHPSSLWTKQIVNELEQLSCQLGLARNTSAKLGEPLSCDRLVQSYLHAAQDSGICKPGSRVFIFDYGGALLHKEKFDIYMKQTLSAIAGRRPSPGMMDAVLKLSEDPLNMVLIITGLTRMKLGTTFKDLKNIVLATSNGLIYSWGDRLGSARDRSCAVSGTSEDDDRSWECMEGSVDWNAVNEIAAPIITKFTFRTNGTCKTPRFPGIGWSYFGADPEWGRKQAAQLTLELEAALAHFDVKIMSLVPGSIEVVPRSLKKGLIVSSFLKRVVAKRGGRLPGLVTVFGAEEADDGMTTAVFDALRDAPTKAELRRLKTYTIAVGKRESFAEFYLNDIVDVERVLTALNDCSADVASQPQENAP